MRRPPLTLGTPRPYLRMIQAMLLAGLLVFALPGQTMGQHHFKHHGGHHGGHHAFRHGGHHGIHHGGHHGFHRGRHHGGHHGRHGGLHLGLRLGHHSGTAHHAYRNHRLHRYGHSAPYYRYRHRVIYGSTTRPVTVVRDHSDTATPTRNTDDDRATQRGNDDRRVDRRIRDADARDYPAENASAAEAPIRRSDAWDNLRSGEYTLAQSRFARLARSSPRDGEPKLGYGLAAALQGKDELTIHAFDRVRRFEPGVLDQDHGIPVETLNDLIERYEYRDDEDSQRVLAALKRLKAAQADAPDETSEHPDDQTTDTAEE